MKKLAVIGLIFVPIFLFSDSWETIIDSLPLGLPHAICKTFDNGFVFTISFGPQSHENLYLVKVDPLGNLLWLKEVFSSPDRDLGYEIEETADKELLVAGTSYGEPKQGFILKTDSLGNALDTFLLPPESNLFCLEKAEDNCWIATGTKNDTAIIIKFTSDLEIIWERNYPGFRNAKAIRKSPDGNEYVILMLGSHPVTLYKIDNNGEVIWYREYPELESFFLPGYLLDGGLAVLSDGGYLSTGLYHPRFPPTRLWRLCLIKLDSNGDTLWTKVFQPDTFVWGLFCWEENNKYWIVADIEIMQNEHWVRKGVKIFKTDENGNKGWERDYLLEDYCIGILDAEKLEDGIIILAQFSNSWIYLIKYEEEEYPPQVEKIEGPTEGTVGENLIFKAFASDPNTDSIRARFVWSDIDTSNWSLYQEPWTWFTFTHTFSDSGTYPIKAQAQDKQGLVSNWSEPFTVEIEPNYPPEILLEEGDNYGVIGETLSFTFRASDPNEDSVKVRVSWSDNDTSSWSEYKESGSTFTFTHAFSDSRAYLIKAQAQDKQGLVGNWSEPFTVEIEPNYPPVIDSIVAPDEAFLGDTLVVKILVSDKNNDRVTVRIRIGKDTLLWRNYQESGSWFKFIYLCSDTGTYPVEVQTKDIRGLISNWVEASKLEIKPTIISVYPNLLVSSCHRYLYFNLPAGSEIEIYNTFGQKIWEDKSEGRKYQWNVKELPSGIYYYLIRKSGKIVAKGKFCIIK